MKKSVSVLLTILTVFCLFGCVGSVTGSAALAKPVPAVANASVGVCVKWGKVKNASGYYVYRKAGSAKSWSRIATVTKGTTVSYTDKKVTSGTKYTYTVKAYRGSTNSSYNTAGVSLYYVATAKFTVANAASGVKISITKVSGASGYNIYRKAGSATSWTKLKNVPATTTSYVDTTVKSGTQYTYTVRACKGGSMSYFDKAGTGIQYLAQPAFKVANEDGGIKVTVTKVTGATGYYIYRKAASAASWTRVATVSASEACYKDVAVNSGTKYTYTVRAFNGSTKSSCHSGSAIVRLDTPTLSAKYTKSYVQCVNLIYGSVEGADGYYIYRKLPGGSWKLIKTVNDGKTISISDKDMNDKTTYIYTVKAFCGNSVSAYDKDGLSVYHDGTKTGREDGYIDFSDL